MKLLLAACLALAPVSAISQPVAGTYRLSQMEMAGALRLEPHGEFRYQLDYGNVSEAAEGRWALRDDRVYLTSRPMSPEVLYDLERNDAKFADQPLAIQGDTLVMERYDARMIFRRVQP